MIKLYTLILIFTILMGGQTTPLHVNSEQKDVYVDLGSWYLYDTGNETITEFKLLEDPAGNTHNTSSSKVDWVQDNYTTGVQYSDWRYDKTSGFLIGINNIADITIISKTNETQIRNITVNGWKLFTFKEFKNTSNMVFEFFGSSNITYSKGYQNPRATYDEDFINGTSELLIGKSQDFVLNNETVKVNFFQYITKRDISISYIEFPLYNTTSTTKFGEYRQTIENYYNGTTIVYPKRIDNNFVEEIYEGYFAPSLFRVVNSTWYRRLGFIENGLQLNSEPTIQIIETKTLEDYHIVLSEPLEETVSSSTSNTISTPSTTSIISTTPTPTTQTTSEDSNLSILGLSLLILIPIIIKIKKKY